MSFAIRTVRTIGDLTAGTVIVVIHVVVVERDARRVIQVPKLCVLE